MKEFKVRCSGKLHRIGYINKKWVLLDHTPETKTMEVLSQEKTKCTSILEFIKDIGNGNFKPIKAEIKKVCGNPKLVDFVFDWAMHKNRHRHERNALRRDGSKPPSNIHFYMHQFIGSIRSPNRLTSVHLIHTNAFYGFYGQSPLMERNDCAIKKIEGTYYMQHQEKLYRLHEIDAGTNPVYRFIEVGDFDNMRHRRVPIYKEQ